MSVKPNDVCIVAATRTPLGNFGGSLSNVSATDLGGVAIKEALLRAKLDPKFVEECYMGNVCSGNLGQAPCRQAATKGGLPSSTICTTINKVCASALKAIMLGAQAIRSGDRHVVVTGGFENMSQVPYYSPNTRFGNKLGDVKLVDGLIKDGLTNPFNGTHMGIAAEECAIKYKISRQDQDDYAIMSIKRAIEAQKNGEFNNEIASVTIKSSKGETIIKSDDELLKKPNFDKLRQLSPAFKKDGTVTAGNASIISDGASCVILVSGEFALKHNIEILGFVRAFDDAEQDPMLFTTTPSIAVQKTLKKMNLSVNDIDAFEINEAFAVVPISNAKILGIPMEKLNMRGSSCSLGHPLGCSGARIVVTLLSILTDKKGRYGSASICNGGGGGSAIIIEKYHKKSNL